MSARGVPLAALTGLLFAASGARAESELAPPARAGRSLADLGLTATRLERERGSRISVPLVTRADRVMLRGELRIRFRPDAIPEDVTGLTVGLNGEALERFDRRAMLDGETARRITLDERLVSGHDTIELALDRADPCAPLPPGAWRLLAAGELETEGTPLPLPAALELLPLPFVDDDFERDPELVFVLPRREPALVEAAAIAVGGFARQVDAHLGVKVQSSLPDGYAVALVDDAESAARLGVPFHARPTAEILERPGRPNSKVLLLSGSGPGGVRAAAVGLFGGDEAEGSRATFEPETSAPPNAGTPSRWLDPSRPLTFERIAGGPLVHRGTKPGTLSASFRVTPDLFGWPRPTFGMRLDYRRIASSETPALLLDVEVNGEHVTRVRVDDASGAQRSARLWIPRESLRGFNEIVLHVHHAGVDACSPFDDAGAELTILPSSVLQLDDFERFASLPDVELFAFDGFPFSRTGGLVETTAILPPEPEAEEVASLLSIIAHFAAITGDLPTGLEVRAEAAAPRALDRDLLLVGAFPRHPALTTWSARSPLSYLYGRPRLKVPERGGSWRSRLKTWFGFGELERAKETIGRNGQVAALLGFPSPVAPGRSVVAITAAEPLELPGVRAFIGFAEARRRGGDLMLVAAGGEVRSRHHIGPTRGVGQLSAWTQIRWEASTSWFALGPALLIGVLLVSWPTVHSLEHRLARRARGRSRAR